MVNKLMVSGAAIVGFQGVTSIPTDGVPILEILKIVGQLVMGAVSLIHLFKKPKEVISNQNKQ